MLRSFALRPPDIVPPKLEAFGVSYGKNTDKDEIFSWIERSAHAAMPSAELITLFGGGDFFGPGQAEVKDEDWKRRVADLCVKARSIVFMAGASPGALWELNFLDQYGMFDKTIFVVPPLVWFISVCPKPTERAVAEFRAMIDQYRYMGIPVADIDRRGAFFALDNDRKLKSFDRIDWTLNSKARLSRALRRVSEGFREGSLAKMRGPWIAANNPIWDISIRSK